MKRTFYFNIGVKPDYSANPPIKPFGKRIEKGGVIQIPFDCENVPENAIFKFACDNDELPGYSEPSYIVREITNSGLLSKFAYFLVPESI